MQMEVTMKRVIYVGLDVHKETNSACMLDWAKGQFFAEAKLDAGCEYLVKYLEKTRKQFGLEGCEYVIGYEAGPTGYGLQRALEKKGYKCIVIAPTTIRKASGERVKTDRKDAQLLAMTLASDAYKAVYVPDMADEAVKEYTRCRNTLNKHLKKAKQNLLSFLLRIGMSYPETGEYWTRKFESWLKSLKFTDRKLQYSFETYWQEVKDLQAKVDAMDENIEEIADEERYKDKVDKLVCFCGIQTHTALSLVCEIGDFSRFDSPEKFASFLGLTPGQDSSGQRQRYTSITKCGNSRLRLLLTEAAKSIKKSSRYGKSKRIVLRQKGQSPAVIAYADKGSKRIRAKMRSLEERGKNHNVASTAGARELACFIWGMMTDHID